MVDALSITIVRNPTYPYTDPPSLNDVMPLLYGKPMTWANNPRIGISELAEVNYLLYRIACHSVFHIFHMHIIPTNWCIFMYALIIGASISIHSLFIQTIVEVNKNTSKNCFYP
mgnify:CR=1 FL=1